MQIHTHTIQGSKGQGQMKAPKKKELVPGTDFALYIDLGRFAPLRITLMAKSWNFNFL
jgi:hypothetical protein